MARVSDAVQNRVKELYALMATAAAKKALSKILVDEPVAAEKWAALAEDWLVCAGADHARHTYERPRL